LPEKFARERLIFPLRETDRRLVVAVADPSDFEAEQLITFASGRSAVFEVAPPSEIQNALDGRFAPDRAMEQLLNRVGADMASEVRIIRDKAPEAVVAFEAESAPIVKLTNVVLADAVRARASDIHVEPFGDVGRIRFRVDGVLQTYTRLPIPALNRVVSCLKIMGGMDIADRMRPQDGRAQIQIDDQSIDLRLSTVPTRDSEKAVVRLLDPRNAKGLEHLALAADQLEPIRSLIGHRDGIVLVTGPTGSGKTTLLYAALREMPAGEINVMTVEDPIEYALPGLTQIQVAPKRGVTFASALKSILRQDPDVIFIGEIRDAETAAIAVQASLTGHLVLASLHTNDAVGAVARFADLGVERGDIASTLRGATAQRLVRRVCPQCAQKVTGALSEMETRLAARYGVQPAVRAVGCANCGQTGYRGRLPLLEILVASPQFETGIIDGATSSQLQRMAVASGMKPLRMSAVDRVRSGETTLEEIDRELGESDPEAVVVAAQPHILIAEDDPVIRALASSLLTAAGYRVSEAVDGVAALELLENTLDVSLVVLDLGMPRMSGREVLDKLRGAVSTSGLPVIVLTGTTDDQMETEIMNAGADDYVRKPLNPERSSRV
ncbi:MAG TPA: ATPase, T2SS/T4P/T4SS family, partial [Gemmatimonadaceae bacterium]|nr:ATPase, T2SS/T4P/T4SS family [Gemmatimonadaceae bacterium]